MIEQIDKWVLDDAGNNAKMVISVQTTDGLLPVATIQADGELQEFCVKTISTRMQDYIVTWDDFKNFIRLVDEAYYRGSVTRVQLSKTA